MERLSLIPEYRISNKEYPIMNVKNTERKFDLEERLIVFAVSVINISENLIDTKAGNYIANQVMRSGTSPALHYGEAQSAESDKDFIHKMKVALKELRETMNALRIIKRKPLTKDNNIDSGLKECNELIAIFVTSIRTAQKNSGSNK